MAHPPMSLTKRQKLMIGTLCTTYGLFYFGRVNISVVLPLLAIELNVSRAEIGILGTVFFWVYAIGNLVCGELGNHVSPSRVVGIGLLASALVNLAFGFQSSLIAMLILWGINGLAQSGGWSPMVRILSERLHPSQFKRVSTIMPFSYVIGTVVTWALIGTVATGDNWRIAFWLPGIVLLLVTALWWKARIDAPKSQSKGLRLSTTLIDARAVSFALLAAALSGFVRNGSIIWLPSYILDTQLIADNLVGLVAAFTQLVALVGILLARHLVVRSNQVFATAVLLLAAAGLAFALLALSSGPLAILLIAFALMLLNGAFGLVTSSFPMLLAPPGRASSITGTLNMMATFAGGLAGFTIGALVEISGWDAVFILWALALSLAAIVVWRNRAREDSHLVAESGQPAAS